MYDCLCLTCRLRQAVVRTSMSYINTAELLSGEADYWSWSHLKTFIGQDEAAEHFYAGSLSPPACSSLYVDVLH